MPHIPAALVKPNAFTFQINNFECTLVIPQGTAVVNLLQLGSELFLGTLERSVLLAEAEKVKQERLGGMIRCARNSADLDERSAQGLDFTLKLIHLALTESWKLPCLVTKYQDQLMWHAGGNRLLASALVSPCPETTLPVLCTDFDKTDTKFLSKTKIKNDQHLADILNVPFVGYSQYHSTGTEKTVEIHLEWTAGVPGPCIHYIYDHTRAMFDWRHHTVDTIQYVYTNIIAIRRMLRNNRVKVYAESPDQVIDSTGFFDIEYVGNSPGKIQDLGPGGLTQLAYRARMFDSIPYKEITVWVTNGRKIDLGELLFWVNTKNNVYVDRDGEFAVMISRNRFSSKQICLSYR
jgi:hypothetical protein